MKDGLQRLVLLFGLFDCGHVLLLVCDVSHDANMESWVVLVNVLDSDGFLFCPNSAQDLIACLEQL